MQHILEEGRVGRDTFYKQALILVYCTFLNFLQAFLAAQDVRAIGSPRTSLTQATATLPQYSPLPTVKSPQVVDNELEALRANLRQLEEEV